MLLVSGLLQFLRLTTFRALTHRNFALFASGQAFALVGYWMQSIAQSWLLYRLTDSATLLGILGFGWLTDFRTLGVGSIVAVLGLAVLGEVVEAYVGFRFAQRYGGSRRAGWGALIGGLIGAIVGVPVPVIGSVIGSALNEARRGVSVRRFTSTVTFRSAIRCGRRGQDTRPWR